MEKVSDTAGTHLRNLKRRRHFDPSILPARWLDLEQRECKQWVFLLCFFGSRFNCFQLRDREDDEQRDARLAKKREREARKKSGRTPEQVDKERAVQRV